MADLPYPGPPGPGSTPPDETGAGSAEPAADAAPEPEAAPQPEHCAVCGAELDPGQTYCLECGAPTKNAPRLRRGAGGLALVAAGLAVLGAGAGALAYVASQDDASASPAATTTDITRVITVPDLTVPTTETDSSLPGDTTATTGTLPMDTTYTTPTVDTTSSTPLPVDTTASVPSGIYTETGPTGGQTTSEFPTTTADPYPTDTSGSSSGSPGGTSSDDWPAGTSGWTAIVSSVRNESDARAAASRLQSQGQPGGVLFSTDHPPLRPGYWVVFSGTYDTRSEALAQARALLPRWPGAYPRQIDS